MVGRDLLSNAVSLNSTLINAGRVIGPAIGGIVFAAVGIAACFFVNAASFIAVIGALALMRRAEITRIRTVTRAKGQIRAGLRYAWNDRELRNVLVSIALVGTMAFNFTVTLPILVLTELKGSATQYSLVMCAMGFGAVIGGLYLAHRNRPTRALLAGLGLAFGLLIAAVAVAPSVLAVSLVLIPMGAVSLAFVSTANSTLQLHSAEEMRGRVMSLYAMAFLGTTPIGALLVAAITEASNVRVALGAGAITTVAAAGLLWRTAGEPRTASLAASPTTA
jgi:predicted MFS family arabinose efflux permease